MRRKEFLEELEEHLIGVSKEDKAEIMQDYKDHFKAGKKDKRTDSQIIKALGNPKIIAREIRVELSKPSEGEDLKSEAIETWVSVKKFTKHLFLESKKKIEIFSKNETERYNKGEFTNELWWILGAFLLMVITGHPLFIIAFIIIGLYSIAKYTNNKNKDNKKSHTKKSKKKNEEKSSLKIVLCLLFNLLIVLWFWIALFFTLIGLFVASAAVILSGAFIIAFSVFALVSYNTPLTKDILFSMFFAGVGTVILGGLFTSLFELLTKFFFKLTTAYITLNMRLVRK